MTLFQKHFSFLFIKIRKQNYPGCRVENHSRLPYESCMHAMSSWFHSHYLSTFPFPSKETRLFLFIRLCQAFQYTQLVYQVKVTIMAMMLAIVLFHHGPGDPDALRSHKLYALLNYLNSLFLSLTLFMPMCIQYFYDTKVSCRRIQVSRTGIYSLQESHVMCIPSICR